MQVATRMIVGAILFGVALIGSSWLLWSNPVGAWVDAALYIALGCFFTYHIVAVLPHVSERHKRQG